MSKPEKLPINLQVRPMLDILLILLKPKLERPFTLVNPIREPSHSLLHPNRHTTAETHKLQLTIR